MRIVLVVLLVLVAPVAGSDVNARSRPTADATYRSSEKFEIAPGFEAKLWAQTPLLHNPTNIDIDARGRIWVAEAVNYRFTTKKDGRGFGLHGAALAAKEMGGTLTAHSDGPGQGATFTLNLPLKTAEVT